MHRLDLHLRRASRAVSGGKQTATQRTVEFGVDADPSQAAQVGMDLPGIEQCAVLVDEGHCVSVTVSACPDDWTSLQIAFDQTMTR